MQDGGKYASRFRAKSQDGLCAVLPKNIMSLLKTDLYVIMVISYCSTNNS